MVELLLQHGANAGHDAGAGAQGMCSLIGAVVNNYLKASRKKKMFKVKHMR